MSDQDRPNYGNLVPAGRHDLAPVILANPLVLRGISDLARMQESPHVTLSNMPLHLQAQAGKSESAIAETKR